MEKMATVTCNKCGGVDFTVELRAGRRVVVCSCGKVYDVNYFLPE